MGNYGNLGIMGNYGNYVQLNTIMGNKTVVDIVQG